MNAKIIRFPTNVDLREPKPEAMATRRLSWWERLFGKPKKRANLAQRRIQRAKGLRQ